MSEAPEVDVIDADNLSDDIDHVFSDLEDLGRMWARHGLTIGKMGLQASAVSAERLANLLGRLADRFEDKDEAAA